MKRPLTLAILFVILTPAVAAYHLSSGIPDPGTNVVDIRNRVLATNTVNLDNAAAGNLMTFEFPWDPEYSFADTGHTIRIHISYTATFPSSSNGAWQVNVAKEQTGNLANCAVRVETVDPIGISLDALLVYAHYEWDCLFTQSTKVHYHYHTVYINRTTLSGSPSAMTAESLAVRLETEDIVKTGNIVENITAASDLSSEEHEALMMALTGFNATELQRALAILMAIKDNSTMLNATLGDILTNITEHRDHSIEVTTMNDFDGLGFDGSLLTLIWFVALIWCLRRGKLLAAAIATVGIAVSGAPGVADNLQLVALLLFAVALWLEAIAHDRIYQRFSKNNARNPP